MKLPGGIFAKASGRLGGLVFATWKGIQYARTWVIPANPRTAPQLAQRALFSNLVFVAKAILGSVIQTFWDPFIKDNSGWAVWMGQNLTAMHPTFDPTLMIVSSGVLEATPPTGCTYAGPNVTFTWSSAVLGNGLATDNAICVVYDFANHVAFVNSAVDRSVGTAAVNCGAGRNNMFMAGYLFFADSATAPTKKSASIYTAVS